MKTLILMRHSHAVSNNPAYSDHDRPLTDEGRRLAKVTASLTSDWKVDQIICSSATRTIETAEELAAAYNTIKPATTSEKLYLASPSTYADVAAELAEADTEVLAVIGHNPGIASLICNWADDYLPIPPATVAVFRMALENWTQLAENRHLTKELVGLVSNGVRMR